KIGDLEKQSTFKMKKRLKKINNSLKKSLAKEFDFSNTENEEMAVEESSDPFAQQILSENCHIDSDIDNIVEQAISSSIKIVDVLQDIEENQKIN
ncbi:MAG: hypothetical protein MHPSP_001998, partial [Paramarteilia canceri]